MVFSVFGIAFAQHTRSASAADNTLTYSNGWLSSTEARMTNHNTGGDIYYAINNLSENEMNRLTNIDNVFLLSEEYYEILLYIDNPLLNGAKFGISFVGAPNDLFSDQRLNIIFKKENDVLSIYFQKGSNLSSINNRAAYFYDENGEKNYNIGGTVAGVDYDAIRIDASKPKGNDTLMEQISIRLYYGFEDTKVVVNTKYPTKYFSSGNYVYKEFEYDEGGERPEEFFVPGELLRNAVNSAAHQTTNAFVQFYTSNTENQIGNLTLRFFNGNDGPDYSSLKEEVAELRREIDEKNSLITALQATTATLRDRELQLTESINTLETRIAALQSDYQANIDEIVALRAEKIALEKQLSVVNAENAKYTSQLALQAQELETLTVKLTGQEEEKAAEKGFFEAVGEWISNNVLYTVLIGVGVVLIIAAAIAIPIIVKKKRS